MAHVCTFDDLLGTLHQRIAQLPGHRKGKNIQYSFPEAAVGAFGIFLTQSPPFLAYQRTLQSTFRTLCPGVMRVFRGCLQAKLGPTI